MLFKTATEVTCTVLPLITGHWGKRKGEKQNTKMVTCHNTFQMGKAKACFLFLPLCEFSVRQREESEHQVKEGCLCPYTPVFSPVPNMGGMQKFLRLVLVRGLGIQHLQMDEGGSRVSARIPVYSFCSIMRKLRSKFLCSFQQEASTGCIPCLGLACGSHCTEPLPS